MSKMKICVLFHDKSYSNIYTFYNDNTSSWRICDDFIPFLLESKVEGWGRGGEGGFICDFPLFSLHVSVEW